MPLKTDFEGVCACGKKFKRYKTTDKECPGCRYEKLIASNKQKRGKVKTSASGQVYPTTKGFFSRGGAKIKSKRKKSEYKRVYMEFFGYHCDDLIPCEISGCQNKANDIHHVDCRGMGGSDDKDFIENLMGLCRKHHIEYGDKKQYREMLITQHKKFMELFGKQ